jgi:hypothetical protein
MVENKDVAERLVRFSRDIGLSALSGCAQASAALHPLPQGF